MVQGGLDYLYFSYKSDGKINCLVGSETVCPQLNDCKNASAAVAPAATATDGALYMCKLVSLVIFSIIIIIIIVHANSNVAKAGALHWTLNRWLCVICLDRLKNAYSLYSWSKFLLLLFRSTFFFYSFIQFQQIIRI